VYKNRRNKSQREKNKTSQQQNEQDGKGPTFHPAAAAVFLTHPSPIRLTSINESIGFQG
jgi:hypothetical protein